MRPLLWDLLSFAGVVLVAAGLGWAWPPAAPIFLGLVLSALGLWGASVCTRPKKRPPR